MRDQLGAPGHAQHAVLRSILNAKKKNTLSPPRLIFNSFSCIYRMNTGTAEAMKSAHFHAQRTPFKAHVIAYTQRGCQCTVSAVARDAACSRREALKVATFVGSQFVFSPYEPLVACILCVLQLAMCHLCVM